MRRRRARRSLRWLLVGAARRQGNLFPVVLLVIFVATVLVAGRDYLTRNVLKQTELLLGADDAFHRAEGLANVIVSGWKKRLAYSFALEEKKVGGATVWDRNSFAPHWSFATSGSMAGWGNWWDSRPYQIGWEIAPAQGDPPSCPASIWVRFTDERPARTFRFDLRLRLSTQLTSHFALTDAVTQDGVDPTSATERLLAFRQALGDMQTRAKIQASTEIISQHVEAVAIKGGTPDAVRQAVLPHAQLSVPIGALDQYLGARATFMSASDPASRVSGARIALQLAVAIPDPDEVAWRGLARYELAGELARAADAPPVADRLTELAGAVETLGAELSEPRPCSSTPEIAWLLAATMMKKRVNFNDSLEFNAQKDDALTRLKSVTDVRSSAFLGALADITCRELPTLFNLIWAKRVAMGIQTVRRSAGSRAPDAYALVSLHPDGSNPLVHLESSTPLLPIGWSADGSTIDVAAGKSYSQDGWERQTVWRVSTDGTRITSVPAGPVDVLQHVLDTTSPPNGDEKLRHGVNITAPDGTWTWLQVAGARESPREAGLIVTGYAAYGACDMNNLDAGGPCTHLGGLLWLDPRLQTIPTDSIYGWLPDYASLGTFSPTTDTVASLELEPVSSPTWTRLLLYNLPSTPPMPLLNDPPTRLTGLPRAALSQKPGTGLCSSELQLWCAGLSWRIFPSAKSNSAPDTDPYLLPPSQQDEWITYMTAVNNSTTDVVFQRVVQPPYSSLSCKPPSAGPPTPLHSCPCPGTDIANTAAPPEYYPCPVIHTVQAQIAPACPRMWPTCRPGKGGTLIKRPRGFVFGTATGLHFVSLPCTGTSPSCDYSPGAYYLPPSSDGCIDETWPANSVGSLSEIHAIDQRRPADNIYFAAQVGGDPSVYVPTVLMIDPDTRTATVLAGSGGLFPGALTADCPVGAPLP